MIPKSLKYFLNLLELSVNGSYHLNPQKDDFIEGDTAEGILKCKKKNNNNANPHYI